MKKVNLVVDEQEVQVLAQKVGQQVWFHYDGETYSYTPQSSASQNSTQAGAQDPQRIVAPMPGKIIKIFVKKGDSVEEGQTLVAMEAMKMEYNLKAVQKMRVESIHCEKDQQVGLGDLLIKLEEQND